MARTVNQAFDILNTKYVNLDPDRTEVARRSRKWLWEQLGSLPGKMTDFPNLYFGTSLNYGSFARNTKIDPLDDIDMMLTFSGDGATYKEIVFGSNYTIYVPSSVVNLYKLCNTDGTLNSIKLVNKLVKSLDQVEHYKAADIHRNQEAAVLDLSSYEWNYDIVPAFKTTTDFYLIPDGSGGWKATDPRKDDEKISRINTKNSGRVNQLIRTLKFWNRRAAMITISPYLFENIILNFCDSQYLTEYIDVNLTRFWDYLRLGIFHEVPDPKGFQGNLNTLTYSEQVSISQKAIDAHNKGHEAFKLETENKNQEAAINKWRTILGDNFPNYE